MFKTTKPKNGFTLIELLVVIAIIGILISIVSMSFSGARDAGNNTTVRSEMLQVYLAMELYEAQYGQYPDPVSIPGRGWCMYDQLQLTDELGAGYVDLSSYASYDNSNIIGCHGDYIEGLVPDFLPSLPTPGIKYRDDCNFIYVVADDRSFYKFSTSCVSGETSDGEGISPDDEMARCPVSCAGLTCGSGVPREDVPTYEEQVAGEEFSKTMTIYSPGGECI